MNICEQITKWVLAATAQGELRLNESEEKSFKDIEAIFVDSTDAGTRAFRKLLRENTGLAKESGRILVKMTINFCHQELAEFERIKTEYKLSEGEKDYLMNTLYPLYHEATELGLRVGRSVDS